MQLVTFAIPTDAYVAAVLAHSPNEWSVALDNSLKERLSPYDTKAELVVALQKRAGFRGDLYRQSLWEGLALSALSVVGLVRERKISGMRRQFQPRHTPDLEVHQTKPPHC